MIEDKKIGLKVAENKEEAQWENVRRKAEIAIDEASLEVELNELILRYANKKLKSLTN